MMIVMTVGRECNGDKTVKLDYGGQPYDGLGSLFVLLENVLLFKKNPDKPQSGNLPDRECNPDPLLQRLGRYFCLQG